MFPITCNPTTHICTQRASLMEYPLVFSLSNTPLTLPTAYWVANLTPLPINTAMSYHYNYTLMIEVVEIWNISLWPTPTADRISSDSLSDLVLSKLAATLVVLPHSVADPERFSVVRRLKQSRRDSSRSQQS